VERCTGDRLKNFLGLLVRIDDERAAIAVHDYPLSNVGPIPGDPSIKMNPHGTAQS
jgi:hypothetical protein